MLRRLCRLGDGGRTLRRLLRLRDWGGTLRRLLRFGNRSGALRFRFRFGGGSRTLRRLFRLGDGGGTLRRRLRFRDGGGLGAAVRAAVLLRRLGGLRRPLLFRRAHRVQQILAGHAPARARAAHRREVYPVLRGQPRHERRDDVPTVGLHGGMRRRGFLSRGGARILGRVGASFASLARPRRANAPNAPHKLEGMAGRGRRSLGALRRIFSLGLGGIFAGGLAVHGGLGARVLRGGHRPRSAYAALAVARLFPGVVRGGCGFFLCDCLIRAFVRLFLPDIIRGGGGLFLRDGLVRLLFLSVVRGCCGLFLRDGIVRALVRLCLSVVRGCCGRFLRDSLVRAVVRLVLRVVRGGRRRFFRDGLILARVRLRRLRRLLGDALRGGRGRIRDGVDLHFADRLAHRDGLPLLDQRAGEDARIWGRRLHAHFVGDHLHQRVVFLDALSRLHQPLADDAFGHRFAHLRKFYRRSHR